MRREANSDSDLSRRRFLATAGAVAGAAALGGSGCSRGSARADSRDLNVLLLVIDSLRADFVASYGAERVQTPNLDSLAQGGLRFTRAFPEAMPTVPARRAMMTGRRVFPDRDWRRVEGLGKVPGSSPIADVDGTFTSLLQRQGYWTTTVTDNPFLGFSEPYAPYRASFHHFAPVPGHVGTVDDPVPVSQRLLRQRLPEGLLAVPDYVEGMRNYLANTGGGRDDSRSNAARVYRQAAELLPLAARNRPFAMVVDCFDPHEPWTPTREAIDMYADPDYRGPDVAGALYRMGHTYLSQDEIRHMRAVYAAELTTTDRWLGVLLERFHELDLADSTAIVLLSDHGLLLGDRGWTGKIPGELHPELMHVPFLIVHPEGRLAGRTSAYFASTHDVAPTILSMLGREPPRAMDGADLSVLFDGGEPPARTLAYGGYYNHFFARDDRWSLVADNRGRERELYDLDFDPYEIENVAGERPEVHEELYGRLLEEVGGPLPFYE